MTSQPSTADEWLESLHREFAPESDRGAALLVGAMLDEALKSLLTKRLVQPAKKDSSLVGEPSAPLGSFASRIDAAFQLGLVSSYFARDLHLIRKIRNEFAHHPLQCTFGSQNIKDWVGALEQASDYNRRQPETREAVGPPGTRWDFLGIAAWMLYNLHRELESEVPLSACGPEFGYIDWDKLPEAVRRILDSGAT